VASPKGQGLPRHQINGWTGDSPALHADEVNAFMLEFAISREALIDVRMPGTGVFWSYYVT
jgi:hypothetical protein